jgi:hypothetical protein
MVRPRDFVILWLVAAVAIFVLIPESRMVAQFVWETYVSGPDYVETEDAVVLTDHALVVSPVAYLPYIWIALGAIGLIVYLSRSRRSA